MADPYSLLALQLVALHFNLIFHVLIDPLVYFKKIYSQSLNEISIR